MRVPPVAGTATRQGTELVFNDSQGGEQAHRHFALGFSWESSFHQKVEELL